MNIGGSGRNLKIPTKLETAKYDSNRNKKETKVDVLYESEPILPMTRIVSKKHIPTLVPYLPTNNVVITQPALSFRKTNAEMMKINLIRSSSTGDVGNNTNGMQIKGH